MKKTFQYLILVAAAIVAFSCNDQSKSDTEMIARFYDRYIFGSDNFVPDGAAMCSAAMLDRLRKSYPYDCPDNNCHAVWLFRTGLQDGPTDECRVTDIERMGRNLYRVDYIDMGIHGSTIIELTTTDRRRLIDSATSQNNE